MTKLEDKNTREYRLYHNITTPEQEMQGLEAIVRNLKRERDELRKERDEARLQTGRILNEIDCRIEHGADSNGHLEGIRSLFKDSKKSQDALDRLAELDQELGLI